MVTDPAIKKPGFRYWENHTPVTSILFHTVSPGGHDDIIVMVTQERHDGVIVMVAKPIAQVGTDDITVIGGP